MKHVKTEFFWDDFQVSGTICGITGLTVYHVELLSTGADTTFSTVCAYQFKSLLIFELKNIILIFSTVRI
jgi:hypothetical protein